MRRIVAHKVCGFRIAFHRLILQFVFLRPVFIQEELRRAKKEIQTEKLKGAATTAATNIAESVGSLFGSNKVKTLEKENTALHREVADHEETIEALQDRIQTMQADRIGKL